jgi:hypothetical protein
VIWEPFVLALFLGLIVSAGLYFAYMWPSIEPLEEPVAVAADSAVAPESTDRDADHDDGEADKPEADKPEADKPEADKPEAEASAPS